MIATGNNTPLSRGFHAAQGVRLLSLVELVAFHHLTRWAGEGCVHANCSALAAQLFTDAEWIGHQIGARAARMRGEA